jgi:radical SAM superfamily enzyme YgiQ (UPF0313 family)
MYQDKTFMIKAVDKVIDELDQIINKDTITKVFLCDGNALRINTSDLIEIITFIKDNFVNCKQISSYATIQDIESKTLEELNSLNKAGLTLLYIGLESGNDEVLKMMNKGITSNRSKKACLKAKKANYKLSVMIIIGLGSIALSYSHAKDSANLLNDINPEYIGLLSLIVEPNTKLAFMVKENLFKELNPIECAKEIKVLLSDLNINNCFFSSVHASNYLYLKGYLAIDKQGMLEQIDYYLDNNDLLDNKYRLL